MMDTSFHYFFHYMDGWNFYALENGGVKIEKRDEVDPAYTLEAEVIIDPDSWESILEFLVEERAKQAAREEI